jgi:hypothetical protein
MGSSKPSKPQYQTPQYTELSLPELRTAISKFIGQEQDFEGLQKTITSSATKKMDALETVQPGYKAGLSQAKQFADSLAEGNIPADVAQRISQSSAFKGLMTGLSGQQRSTVEARDLGLTTLDLQGRGLATQQALRGEANALMPLQAMNLAFTPQTIRSEDVSLAQYNNQVKNQQATANANTYNRQQDANYAYDAQYGGSPLSGILGGVGGAAIGGAIGSVVPGIGTLAGAGLGSALGGGIGGAFGGAQSQQFGGIFSNIGSSLAGLAMPSFGGGAMGNGIFSNMGQAKMAAPYAASYTNYGGGFVPRAEAVTALNPNLPNSKVGF